MMNGSGLGSWDSSRLVLLRQGEKYCVALQIAFTTDGITEGIASILARARGPSARSTARKLRRPDRGCLLAQMLGIRELQAQA